MFSRWRKKSSRSARPRPAQRVVLCLEGLETRDLLSTSPLAPVVAPGSPSPTPALVAPQQAPVPTPGSTSNAITGGPAAPGGPATGGLPSTPASAYPNQSILDMVHNPQFANPVVPVTPQAWSILQATVPTINAPAPNIPTPASPSANEGPHKQVPLPDPGTLSVSDTGIQKPLPPGSQTNGAGGPSSTPESPATTSVNGTSPTTGTDVNTPTTGPTNNLTPTAPQDFPKIGDSNELPYATKLGWKQNPTTGQILDPTINEWIDPQTADDHALKVLQQDPNTEEYQQLKAQENAGNSGMKDLINKLTNPTDNTTPTTPTTNNTPTDPNTDTTNVSQLPMNCMPGQPVPDSQWTIVMGQPVVTETTTTTVVDTPTVPDPNVLALNVSDPGFPDLGFQGFETL